MVEWTPHPSSVGVKATGDTLNAGTINGMLGSVKGAIDVLYGKQVISEECNNRPLYIFIFRLYGVLLAREKGQGRSLVTPAIHRVSIMKSMISVPCSCADTDTKHYRLIVVGGIFRMLFILSF